MEERDSTRQEMIEENRKLKERLLEAEEIIHAIQSGEVDALVIHKQGGEHLYTLSGADHGYRVLVESIIESALILSSDNTVYYCNRALGQMLGVPIQKIIGGKLEFYVASENHTQLMDLLGESRSTGTARGEFLLKTIEGRLLPVNVSLNSLRIDDFEGICAVITDLSEQKRIEEELRRHRAEFELLMNERTADLQQEITERKRMEEELRKSRDELELRVQERTEELITTVAKLESLNRELQEFAFIASHDLQEPLRKIQTFGNILIRKHNDCLNIEGQDYMARIIKGANRMSGLLRALLNYSRSGTSKLNHQRVSLNEVAEDAVCDLESLIKKAGGRIEISDLPTVDADPPLLRQVFQNIIENSIKYRKESEPPIVKIHGSCSDSVCRISIEDNGIGLEECHYQRIFQPFERLHGKSSPYTGTGMGLAICRKIVARHGGGITVKSIPGQGTTFTVTLPLEQKRGD